MGSVHTVAASIDIVLPCLDEVGALPWVLDRIPEGASAVVVDNGSSDGSAELAHQLGARVVHCAERGYGAACHAGLLASTADIVAVCDCDGSLDPGAITEFVEGLRHGMDLIVARRRTTGYGAWPLHARIANRELARRVRKRTGLQLRDIGPIRVARRDALLALDIRDRRSGYPVETVVRAARAGWRVGQVDVNYTPRIGRSKVTGTVRGSLQAVRDMSRALTL